MMDNPEKYQQEDQKMECSSTGEPSITLGDIGGEDDEDEDEDEDEESQRPRPHHFEDHHEEDDEEPQAPEDNLNNKLVLARNETKAVRCLRVALLLVLIGLAAVVSAGIFLFTKNDETQEFRDTFDNYSQRILNTIQVYAQNKLEACGAIALDVQIYAVTNNSTWPNVTLPFFEERAMVTKSLHKAYGVLLFPIVTAETRAGWEEYSVQHRDWIWDSYATQRQVHGEDGSQISPPELLANPESIDWWNHLWGPDYVDPNNVDFSTGIASQIMTTEHEDPDVYDPIYDNSTGPYFPQWQTAPMTWYYQSTVNSNYGYFTDFLKQTMIVNKTGHAVWGEAWQDDSSPGYISTMLYPIFDKFYSTDARVVAFLAIDIFWESFLERILPPNSDGIDVVIQNTCDQVFTFQLLGEKVEWKGEGDLHDPAFDFMERSTLFGQYLMEPITNSTYTGLPLDGSFCPYTFRVYPTKQMKGHYVTNRPAVYTAIACFIMLWTSLIFVCYDYLVARRQRIVKASARRSDAIVSSLFPAPVKEQLYEHQDRSMKMQTDSQRTHRQRSIVRSARPHLGLSENSSSRTVEDRSAEDVEQIASLYPETTILFADILFADIAGFTKWSDGRDPHEVFLLLETIYFMFDKLAKRRGVFKFSTIGDCYLAATGIPRPQNDHAVRMVKFARDCQESLPNLLAELSDRLGEGTRNLAIRVGCHSGPVTAGVLRGDKIRFELFGDTVNTASRMESNGQPNRIHVSQATADLLIEANKGHWLTPREEKVFAKGKGDMQTYFVTVKGTGSVRSFAARHSELLGEGHASLLLEEAIDCFEKISRRQRSTRCLNVSASMLLGSDDEEDSSSTGAVDQPLIEKHVAFATSHAP